MLQVDSGVWIHFGILCFVEWEEIKENFCFIHGLELKRIIACKVNCKMAVGDDWEKKHGSSLTINFATTRDYSIAFLFHECNRNNSRLKFLLEAMQNDGIKKRKRSRYCLEFTVRTLESFTRSRSQLMKYICFFVIYIFEAINNKKVESVSVFLIG